MEVPLIITLIILIFLSAFFSCSETAYTSASHVRLERLSIGKKSAKTALWLADHYERLLSTILIGNNIVNIGASTISTILFIQWLGGTNGPLVSTLVLTVIVLIFGEIIPKNFGKEIPERMAMLTAYPLIVFYYIFFVFSVMFDKLMNVISLLFHLGKKEPSLTEDELKMIVSDIKEEGVINQNEHDLIQKSILFDDQTVEKIMTPWKNAVTVTDEDSDYEIKLIFEMNNYSRIPYLDKDTGEVLGFLLQKDFYEMLLEENCSRESLINEPIFVEGNELITGVFKKFQVEKSHMAIVTDDANRYIGLVSMEDIIEELVGEIEDEYDAENEEERINYFRARGIKESKTQVKPGVKAKLKPKKKVKMQKSI